MSDGLGKQLAPAQAAGRPTHGADQRDDGTALSTGIPRVAPTARAPPARPGGAGTGGAKKPKGKNKVYAVAKGFSTGLFESWAECEQAVKGFKDATHKSFESRIDALAYLESHGVTMAQKEALPPRPQLSMEQLARIEAQLPKFFHPSSRPRAALDIVPKDSPTAPAAYYLAGTPDGARPGRFLVNVANVRERPKYEMAALALHEASLPGLSNAYRNQSQ